MSLIGLQYRFNSPHAGASRLQDAYVGQIIIVNLDIAWQTATPIPNRWNDGSLIVQVVRDGTRWMEQRGEQGMKCSCGDVAVVDPLYWYKATVHAQTSMSILRIPRSALRERGLHGEFPVICCPDPANPDVRAVRDFILYMTSQAGKASNAMLVQLSEQCMDLADVLVSDRSRPAPKRSNAVTVLRAKQLIARRIGDHDLCVASIAAELNMTPRNLTFVLQAGGLSPMRYVWSVRLEHAARLLVGASRGDIKTLAHQCGFASPAHFARVFKARYDMTPRDYMESHKTARRDAVNRCSCATCQALKSREQPNR
ncbi:helix-turn-helix domain-containing protein [Paraburkholderia humisilvae]|nr:AraC family transcriptional regulator [Paraburkholderia humisilvae]